MKTKFNKKAFTLVELLIVIAIIGILFVVLVSKVDFATDKASTTGVQTDFRSFQIAFETVSREKAGFNSLGWDTGDNAGCIAKDGPVTIGGVNYTYANADKDGGDRVRNSYDKGDLNLNGICEEGETWVGQKIYTETWTGIYTLDNPADNTDMSAYLALEKAINKNLDPALQISIDPENKTIYMANGYQDPWKTEYHGFYLSNAANDGMDRGAIVMYSDGPNKVFGSEQTIAKGIVSVTVKNGGINGQDDLSLITCYTYTNGYGEVATMTEGFSNNQVLSNNGNAGVESMFGPGAGGYEMLSGDVASIIDLSDIEIVSEADIGKFKGVKLNGNVVEESNYTVTSGSTKVTIKSDYFKTIKNGVYKLEIVSSDGTAEAELVVAIHVLGDMDGNRVVNSDDAIALQRYTEDRETYPISNVSFADIDGNGLINEDDATYLLRHTLSPAAYPLGIPTEIAALGDVDGNKVINSNDAIALNKYVKDPVANQLAHPESADVNADGVIDEEDALYLLRHTLMPSKYPLG